MYIGDSHQQPKMTNPVCVGAGNTPTLLLTKQSVYSLARLVGHPFLQLNGEFGGAIHCAAALVVRDILRSKCDIIEERIF